MIFSKRALHALKYILIVLPIGAVLFSAKAYIDYREEEIRRQQIEKDTFFSPAVFRVDEENIGCRALIDNYCASLYGKDAAGNLKIEDGKKTRVTLQGKTTNNFDTATFAYNRARLQRRNRLPKDLREALVKREFYPKIEKLLTRPSRKKMPIEESIYFFDLENEVDRIWNNAIEETVTRRLSQKFQGLYLVMDDEMSQDIELERRRLRYRVWSEISVALWKDQQNWNSVLEDFAKLKTSFNRAIQQMEISDDLKSQWITKIKKVRLTLPGQSVVTANNTCISTSQNAYYYPYQNTLTVCAGYFNGGQQIQTLAHELAHALDFNSRLIDFQQSNEFVGSIRHLKDMVCGKTTFQCEDWAQFREGFPQKVQSLSQYQPELPEFHSCLQKNKPSREITSTVIEQKAERITRARFSDLTSSSAFLRMISEKMPSADGAEAIPNNSFLNPCSSHLWDSDNFQVDSELTSLIFFTATYRCEGNSDPKFLRSSIEDAKRMTQTLMLSVLKSEGAFSSRAELQSEHYSSPSGERFADRMASYAVADYLKQYPTLSQVRSAYLASSFWLCDKPSLKKSNYHHYQSLRDLIIDRAPHRENDERMLDWLSPALVNRLSCQPEFTDLGCSP